MPFAPSHAVAGDFSAKTCPPRASTRRIASTASKIPRDVIREESQDHVAIFLQQLVLAPVTAVRNRVAEVLSPIDFVRIFAVRLKRRT